MYINTNTPPNNGAVMTIAQIIKPIMSSAAEAELAAFFINCQEAVPARQSLEEMGHKQPPTLVQTDNTTAHGVVLIETLCGSSMVVVSIGVVIFIGIGRF